MGDCAHCREKAARAAIAPANNVRLDLAARKYLSVPFLHQGRNPAVGIDCVGLGQLAALDCGLSLPDWTDYGRNPANGLLEARLRAIFGEPICCVSPGCVVSIDFRGQTRHVAIVGEHPHGLSLIHTASNVGRVVEHALTDTWRKRITGIYRVEAAE